MVRTGRAARLPSDSTTRTRVRVGSGELAGGGAGARAAAGPPQISAVVSVSGTTGREGGAAVSGLGTGDGGAAAARRVGDGVMARPGCAPSALAGRRSGATAGRTAAAAIAVPGRR